MPPGAVLLFVDATILRLFPPLRYAWAFRGQQAVVRISGQNAKCVLFGAINPVTGHRLILRRPGMRQQDCQAFFQHLRDHYPGRPLWLLLNRAPGQAAAKTQALAARLGIVLLWLPKKCSELNAVDHLWRELKRLIAANRQFPTMDVEADYAVAWFLGLSARAALRKAGILSKHFWLRDFLRNFCKPT
jgi:hypothetical protein